MSVINIKHSVTSVVPMLFVFVKDCKHGVKGVFICHTCKKGVFICHACSMCFDILNVYIFRFVYENSNCYKNGPMLTTNFKSKYIQLSKVSCIMYKYIVSHSLSINIKMLNLRNQWYQWYC